MNELKISPDQLFGTSDTVQITINDIPTQIVSLSDSHGNYFAIRATDKELSNICGDFILGKLITEVDYLTYDGHVVAVKAYY